LQITLHGARSYFRSVGEAGESAGLVSVTVGSNFDEKTVTVAIEYR